MHLYVKIFFSVFALAAFISILEVAILSLAFLMEEKDSRCPMSWGFILFCVTLSLFIIGIILYFSFK